MRRGSKVGPFYNDLVVVVSFLGKKENSVLDMCAGTTELQSLLYINLKHIAT